LATLVRRLVRQPASAELNSYAWKAFYLQTCSNRNLSGRPLCHWWPQLGYPRITRVVVRSARRSHIPLRCVLSHSGGEVSFVRPYIGASALF
jgi:hypothetical protein